MLANVNVAARQKIELNLNLIFTVGCIFCLFVCFYFEHTTLQHKINIKPTLDLHISDKDFLTQFYKDKIFFGYCLALQ